MPGSWAPSLKLPLHIVSDKNKHLFNLFHVEFGEGSGEME